MKDYAESLVNLHAAMKDYRQAVLKNDMKNALYWSNCIREYAQDLFMWTNSEAIDVYDE